MKCLRMCLIMSDGNIFLREYTYSLLTKSLDSIKLQYKFWKSDVGRNSGIQMFTEKLCFSFFKVLPGDLPLHTESITPPLLPTDMSAWEPPFPRCKSVCGLLYKWIDTD